MSPPANISSPIITAKSSRMTGWKWQFPLLLLGLAMLGMGVVYAMDPWHWRKVEGAPSAAFHWDEAHKAMQERDFAVAREHLAKCLDNWPLNAEAHFLMARACRRGQEPSYLRVWQQQLG